MPTSRDFRGHVPRNHLGHSSKISTESPTSKERPQRTSPCQLWIAEEENVKRIQLETNKKKNVLIKAITNTIIIPYLKR